MTPFAIYERCEASNKQNVENVGAKCERNERGKRGTRVAFDFPARGVTDPSMRLLDRLVDLRRARALRLSVVPLLHLPASQNANDQEKNNCIYAPIK